MSHQRGGTQIKKLSEVARHVKSFWWHFREVRCATPPWRLPSQTIEATRLPEGWVGRREPTGRLTLQLLELSSPVWMLGSYPSWGDWIYPGRGGLRTWCVSALRCVAAAGNRSPHQESSAVRSFSQGATSSHRYPGGSPEWISGAVPRQSAAFLKFPMAQQRREPRGCGWAQTFCTQLSSTFFSNYMELSGIEPLTS